jgi:predicted GIY-YIG superfamily endonuclease
MATAVLPYQQAVSNKISRLLTKYNTETVHVPIKKNRQFLGTVKDDLGLKIPGVYRIPCECGKVYIGQTGRSIEARCKEHMRHIRLDQTEKSAVAEHSINAGQQIISSASECWTEHRDTWAASSRKPSK